jgi:hypothetical protein
MQFVGDKKCGEPAAIDAEWGKPNERVGMFLCNHHWEEWAACLTKDPS